MTVIATAKANTKALLATRPDVLIVAVDTVERDVGEVAEQLQAVLEVKPRHRPKVVVMAFNGFDDDPRELDAIPEVRAWCRRFLDGVTSSTLLALTDERTKLHNPGHQEILGGSVGLLKFVAIAGYGKRCGPQGHHLALTPEGAMVVACLTGQTRGTA